MSSLFDALLGYTAATLTTFALLPQAMHSWRTRDVSGISLGMYAAFTLGLALWLIYGLRIGALPVVVANAASLAFASFILVVKLRHRGPAAATGK